MAERRVTTKAELMADNERSWAALNARLGQLTEVQMTTPKDAQGWTVKDHLIHLTYWERSVIFLLRGKPRHEGLEVGEALYLRGDFDEINAAIYRQHRDQPLSEATAQLRNTHRQMMDLLQPLTDEDLRKPYRRYLPEEPGEGDGPSVLEVIYGNTAGHFDEHLDWIEALVKGSLV